MANEFSDRLFVINDLVKGILQGKYYIEDLYKDNGNPKVIGQGNFTQEKYDRIISDRTRLLRQYKRGMDYIKEIGSKEYSEEVVTLATNIGIDIQNDLNNDRNMETRFPKLPSKKGDKKSI